MYCGIILTERLQELDHIMTVPAPRNIKWCFTILSRRKELGVVRQYNYYTTDKHTCNIKISVNISIEQVRGAPPQLQYIYYIYYSIFIIIPPTRSL